MQSAAARVGNELAERTSNRLEYGRVRLVDGDLIDYSSTTKLWVWPVGLSRMLRVWVYYCIDGMS